MLLTLELPVFGLPALELPAVKGDFDCGALDVPLEEGDFDFGDLLPRDFVLLFSVESRRTGRKSFGFLKSPTLSFLGSFSSDLGES